MCVYVCVCVCVCMCVCVCRERERDMTQVCAVNSSFIDSFNKYLLGISLVFTDIGTKSSQTIIFFYF